MSPSFGLTQGEGRKAEEWRGEDAYCWHHYDQLLKRHYLLVPVLATLSLRTALPGRFDKPHFKRHKFREIQWLAQGHRGIVGGMEISRQVKLEVPVLSPTYGHVASCNKIFHPFSHPPPRSTSKRMTYKCSFPSANNTFKKDLFLNSWPISSLGALPGEDLYLIFSVFPELSFFTGVHIYGPNLEVFLTI